MRFLIDECLSVDLVTVAGDSGHEARHVAHVGRAGWKDWNVMRYAGDGDFKVQDRGFERVEQRQITLAASKGQSKPAVNRSHSERRIV